MQLEVFDKNFTRIRIIDVFESLIWTDRYYKYGDFELYMPMDTELLDYLQIGNYLYLAESRHTMMILRISTTTDVDDGDHMIITGRSLESILARRCIQSNWAKRIFENTPVNTLIEQLVDESFIHTAEERVIPGFYIWHNPELDGKVANVSVEINHENLYGIIESLCESHKIGFQIILDDNNNFQFSLYKGVDRSYRQDERSYVIFSPQFDNIIESEYVDDVREMRNVAYCAGKEEEYRQLAVYGDATGLERREIYIDVADVGSDTPDAYNKLMEKGRENLNVYRRLKEFNGQVDATRTFIYDVDFFMGDIVQVIDEYGLQGSTYVTEMIFSQSETGTDIYPTFTFADD